MISNTPGYRGRPRQGFSLVEILVVVAVVAVATTIAVISVRGVGIERTLEREAHRFASFTHLVCDRAVASGREHGIHVARSRYGASRVRRGDWALERDGALAPHDVAEGVGLRLVRDGVDQELALTLDGDPALVCLPGGELTPFELVLVAPGSGSEERVRARFDGRVERVRPQP